MKLPQYSFHPQHPGTRRGSALIMLLGILALLMGIAAANHSNVNALHREVRMIEKQQIQRMEARFSITNPPAATPVKTTP
jgi:Tfp pilus assembly protein PilV